MSCFIFFWIVMPSIVLYYHVKYCLMLSYIVILSFYYLKCCLILSCHVYVILYIFMTYVVLQYHTALYCFVLSYHILYCVVMPYIVLYYHVKCSHFILSHLLFKTRFLEMGSHPLFKMYQIILNNVGDCHVIISISCVVMPYNVFLCHVV